MNAASSWRAVGLMVIVLLAFGMISDKTERIAIWIAGILAGTLFLKKFGQVIQK